MSAESNTARLLAMRPLMEAFLKGEKIEMLAPGGRRWISVDKPAWTADYKYRVKKEPRVYYIAVCVDDTLESYRRGDKKFVTEADYNRKMNPSWEYIKVVEQSE